ncbi:MAG: hypothetical protein ACPGU1_16360 [Myxococcota bacterium]
MAHPIIDLEQSRRIVDALTTRYGRMLREERFSVSGRLEEGSVVVVVVLERHDRTFRYETCCAKAIPEDESESMMDTVDLCLDFLDWHFGQYFDEERELMLPLDWQRHRFGDGEVIARGDVRNPVLDDAADAWLRGER